MILTAGTAIRFKGDNSDRAASEFADSIRGHCALQGSKIVITKRTEIQVKLRNNGGAKASAAESFNEHFFGRRDLRVYRQNGNGA
jgi:hypothetical protein